MATCGAVLPHSKVEITEEITMTHTEQLRAALEKYLDRLDIMFRVGMPEYDLTDMQETLDKARAALAAAPTEQAAPEPYDDDDFLTVAYMHGFHKGVEAGKTAAPAAPTEQAAVPSEYFRSYLRHAIDILQGGEYSTGSKRSAIEAIEEALAAAAPESKDRRAGYIEGLEAAAKVADAISVAALQRHDSSNDDGDLGASDAAIAISEAVRALIDKEPG